MNHLTASRHDIFAIAGAVAIISVFKMLVFKFKQPMRIQQMALKGNQYAGEKNNRFTEEEC